MFGFFRRRSIPKPVRSVGVAIVWLSVFFLLGYGPIMAEVDQRVCIVILAGAAIPFGATARSAWRGVLRGLGLGIAAGAGLIWGMLVTKAVPPLMFDQVALTWALGCVFVTTAVAWLFAVLAQRRRRMAEQSWNP